MPRSFKTKAAGKEIEVPLFNDKGEINPDLIEGYQKREAFYQKMQAVAEQRREVEAMRLKVESEAQQAAIAAKRAALPPLADDDPIKQHQTALQEQLDAQAKTQAQMQELIRAEAQERLQAAEAARLEASKLSLAAEEKRLATEHGLTEREIGMVEREYFVRSRNKENVTLESIAQEHKAYVTSLKEAALKEWKDKNRVGSGAAPETVPATGTATPTITPGSPGFAEAIAEDMRAMFGRR
jgi:hypothetical protein